MKDYKDTLNLPKTDFPMKANLAEREPQRLAMWEADELYQTLRRERAGRPTFILHDGPPYANGQIHIGHVLNKVLKDIVVKVKTLDGLDAPFVPGWDCHGLPIEVNVEKKVGKPGHTLSAKDFRAACRAYALTQVDVQRQEFMRLGILGDWQHPYLTMDHQFEANIVRSLATLLKKECVRRGLKPVYWCIDCASALAEAEVEYANKRSLAIDVGFTVVDAQAFLAHCKLTQLKKITVPIWTTTPWTLPANYAVALNAAIDYVLVEAQDQYFLIAEALLESVLARYGISEHSIVARLPGAKFAGVLLQHPLYHRQVPIILSDHVTVEDGTGCVHIAPAHGLDDYQLGKQYDLPLTSPVQDNGCYAADLAFLGGRFIRSVDAEVAALLKTNHVLLAERAIEHSYPHCWRHKTPLIFRTTPQWFVVMDETRLREKSLSIIDQVKWIPARGFNRMQSMLASRPDWCISRQRTWGVPLPFITHKKTGALHPNMPSILEKIAHEIEKMGVDAWYDLPLSHFMTDAEEYINDHHHVLDVWFDSGVTHACVLETNPALSYPADLYLEGADQHRGWFQTSLLTAVGMRDSAPFRAVLTHGFTLDGEGRKMSKSLGNVILPEKILKTLGADILRLWVASCDYQNDVNISDEILKRTSDAYRRLRNTARFLLSNLHDFDPKLHLMKTLLPLDRWIVAQAYRVQQAVRAAYEVYEFHRAHQLIHHFCTVTLGTFYLDIIKDRQYTAKASCAARRSGQSALYHIAQALVRWLAPVLSFTAEEIWEHLPGKNTTSVLLTTWYEDLNDLSENDKLSHEFWEEVQLARNVVNKEIERLRANSKMGGALEAEVHLYADEKWFALLSMLDQELRFVLLTSDAVVQPLAKATSTAVNTDIPGLRVEIIASLQQKCVRCWQHRRDVGQMQEHPELCGRCVENVEGQGEVRHYA